MKKVLLLVLTLCLAMVFAVGCIPDQLEVEERPETVAPERRSVAYLLQDYVAGKNKMFDNVDLDGMVVSVRIEDTSMIYTYVFDLSVIDEAEARRTIAETEVDGSRVLSEARVVAPELSALILEFQDTGGGELDRATFTD